jgi:predicted RNase H-like nuclease (RuvC/YqgF family)
MPDCPIHGENTIVKLRDTIAKLEAEVSNLYDRLQAAHAERDELKAKVAQLRTRFHEQEQWDE